MDITCMYMPCMSKLLPIQYVHAGNLHILPETTLLYNRIGSLELSGAPRFILLVEPSVKLWQIA